MAVKAVVADEKGTRHLIIGLSRENVEYLLSGEVFVLPQGVAVNLTEQSDIVIMFGETDKDIGKRFPPALRPI